MKRTVFLVDDSGTMLLSLKSTLEIAGFQVDMASDGQSALDKIRQGLRPDLIITDIDMPRLDGLGLIAEARKLLRFTPILTLTTEKNKAKREEAKRLGATGWLVKPVGGKALLQVVDQVLSGK